MGGDPEALGILNDILNADFAGQLKSWNIPRLREGAPQRDDAFKLFVIIVGRVRPGAAFKSDRLIQRSCRRGFLPCR